MPQLTDGWVGTSAVFPNVLLAGDCQGLDRELKAGLRGTLARVGSTLLAKLGGDILELVQLPQNLLLLCLELLMARRRMPHRGLRLGWLLWFLALHSLLSRLGLHHPIVPEAVRHQIPKRRRRTRRPAERRVLVEHHRRGLLLAAELEPGVVRFPVLSHPLAIPH